MRSRSIVVFATIIASLLALLVASPTVIAGHHHRHHHRHHHHHRRHHRRHTFVPPHHKKFHGVSDTRVGLPDFRTFAHRVRAHPAVLEDFFHWDTPLTSGALHRWHQARARGVLSLSTAPGGAPEIISPGGIAAGHDDHYMVGLNTAIAHSKQVVYIRLMPEMNGSWSPYSAINENGSRRNRSHSTTQFRKAWRRFTIIVRGGKVRRINHRLTHLGMPRLFRARPSRHIYDTEHVHGKLPHAKASMIWTPQSISSPPVPANAVGKYWPGKRYVDWVGADIFSKWATGGIRAAFTNLYRRYRGFPFSIGEYSPYDSDPNGAFVRWLFHWAKDHGRTRMLVYYRSVFADNIFDINHYSAAKRVLRHVLNRRAFASFAPEYRRRHR